MLGTLSFLIFLSVFILSEREREREREKRKVRILSRLCVVIPEPEAGLISCIVRSGPELRSRRDA